MCQQNNQEYGPAAYWALKRLLLTARPEGAKGSPQDSRADGRLLKGKGEVFLRDRWVEIEPGDIAYFPEGLERATRNPRDNDRDFVLVNSISPPQFDLYEPFGYYDKEQGVVVRTPRFSLLLGPLTGY